jgi:hypothetical protein
MVAQSTQLTQMAQERIDSFDRQYGSIAVNFACHAAFPLSLTTELSYCLREKFFPNPALWSIAPQLLLSGLCDRKGHDLYVMDFSVRGTLLKRLLENEKFGTARLDELADFMAGYILDGISQKTKDITHEQIFSERSRVFGYPPAIIKFTALSLLKQDSELTEIIRRELKDLLRQTTNPRDRLQLAMFVESQDNLLESIGLTSFSLLDLAQSIADDTSGDELGCILNVMKEYKFPPLKQQIVKYVTIGFVQNSSEPKDLNHFKLEIAQPKLTDLLEVKKVQVNSRETILENIQLNLKSIVSELENYYQANNFKNNRSARKIVQSLTLFTHLIIQQEIFNYSGKIGTQIYKSHEFESLIFQVITHSKIETIRNILEKDADEHSEWCESRLLNFITEFSVITLKRYSTSQQLDLPLRSIIRDINKTQVCDVILSSIINYLLELYKKGIGDVMFKVRRRNRDRNETSIRNKFKHHELVMNIANIMETDMELDVW